MVRKNLSLLLGLFFVFSFSMWVVNCGGPSTTSGGEGKKAEGKSQSEVGTVEKSPADGGTKKDTGGYPDRPAGEKAPAEKKQGGEQKGKEKQGGDISMTFDPPSGSTIDVKDICITVNFSSAPSKSDWTVSFLAQGDKIDTPVTFTFETDQKAKVCPIPVLRQGTSYKLTVKVKEDGGDKYYTGSASYKTKEPYSKDKPADAGLTVSLKIDKIVSPAGLASLIEGRGDLPPIILTLHQRDSGQSGKLVFVGGLGMAAPGKKPFTGNDIINTKQPVSLALSGQFKGRAFYVGPSVFVLSVAGYSLTLNNFTLTGLFSTDGKKLEDVRLTGMIDPMVIEKQFGFPNVCLLVECVKDANGKDMILVGGKLSSYPNPLPFTIFLTKPYYLETGVATNAKVEFYSNQELTQKSLSFKLYTCTGSSDQRQPCSKKKGATVSPANITGSYSLDSTKKHGFFTPDKALSAGTWYKVEVTGTNKNNDKFTTFLIFKTK